MSISLDNAVVYDEECFPNAWTLAMVCLHNDTRATWEISEFRDDRYELRQWLNWLAETQTPMIGFNNAAYDYMLLHLLWQNPDASYADLYAKSQAYFESQKRQDQRFLHSVWPRDWLAPQIDLMAMNRFNTQAKATSLKALEFAMRRESVKESTVPFGVPVTREQIDTDVIPYGYEDVEATKDFALISLDAINFRIGMVPQYGMECLSWDDVKIGAQMLIRELGEDLCYTRDPNTNRKSARQTVRTHIPVNDMVFPYIQFRNPELNRVLTFMRGVTMTASDMSKDAGKDETSPLTIEIEVAGVPLKFGSGGVHGSLKAKKFQTGNGWTIEDDDVGGMYPAISNVNRLAPEHLGEPFVAVYARLPQERAKYPKGTLDNKRFKLAGNAAWGQSKMPYGPFYDPKYALTIPINGQLLICMLIDWLLDVPSFKLIQANTDGITYMLHESDYDRVQEIKQAWQQYTCLILENARYNRLWIKDVSNYVAEDMKGKLKLKGGAYWHPDPTDYANSITAAESWHKDLSALVVPRAAVMAMVHGIDPEHFIRAHTDPFDFMLRAKVGRSDTLLIGDVEQQRVTRYYVAKHGGPMVKISPPVAGGVVGQWKRANGVTKAEYDAEMQRTGGEWSEAVCTKNRSKYTERRTAIQAGYVVAECNRASDFRFDNLNYDFYINEARKLIIQ